MMCAGLILSIMQRKQEYMRVDNLIIDGTNIEFRIFYIARQIKTTNNDGIQTSCIYRFLHTFNKLIEKFDPTNIYAAWDRKLSWPSTNFRKEILIDQYKAGRKKPPDVHEMFDQEVRLIEMLESLGVKNIYPNVLEADDVCAWLADTLKGVNIIVSVDHDLLQLISPTTSVYNLKELITYNNFEEKMQLKPEHYKLFKAIKGDPSDNIKGIEGYGEVRSRKLAAEWNVSNLSDEYKQIIERNLKLIDLQYGYNHQQGEKQKYEEQMNYVKDIKPDLEKFKQLCKKYNFTAYINDPIWNKLVNRNNIVDIINSLYDK